MILRHSGFVWHDWNFQVNCEFPLKLEGCFFALSDTFLYPVMLCKLEKSPCHYFVYTGLIAPSGAENTLHQIKR